MAERRFDWKVPLLAVAVGAVAGGLGAWSSKHSEAEAQGTAAGVAKPQHERPEVDEPVDVARPRARGVALEPTIDLLTECDDHAIASTVRVRRLDEELIRTRWTEVWRGKTDVEGKLPLTLDPGNYGVIASAPCGNAFETITVRAGEARHAVNVVLDSGRAISGRVVEASSGNPIPDALVSARTLMRLPSGRHEAMVEEEAVTTTADSYGRFRLEHVAKAKQTLHANANGFGDAELEVEAPGDSSELELKLERSCPLFGQVRGGGEAAVTLTVRSDSGEASVFVNPDGTFRALAPPGDVQVVAHSATGLTALTRFPLTRECKVKPIELTLGPAGAISGKAIVEGVDQPLACARVWARTEADSYELASAQAAPDGSFTLQGLPPGFYWVLASCATGERGDVLHVSPGASIEVRMRGASGLSGRVVDQEDEPLAGVKVEVGPAHGSGYEAVTDAAGEFSLEHLPAIAMWVVAKGNRAASEDQQLQLRPGVVERVELKLQTIVVLSGHVKGTVPKGSVVSVMRLAEHGGDRAPIGADGSFRFELPPGTYGIQGIVPHRGELFPFKKVQLVVGHDIEWDFVAAEAPEKSDLSFSSVAPGEIGVSFDRGPGGLSISWIASDGPAYAAGAREGDLLLSIDGQPVDDTLEAYTRARGTPGSPMVMQVRREGHDLMLALNRQAKNEPF